MRYGGRLNRLEFTALIDQQANRIRANATTLPLWGPAGWTGPCRVGAWGWENERLVHAGLLFGDAVAGGAWIEVVTTAGPPMPLLIDVRMAAADEPPHDGRGFERALRAASAPAPQRVGIAVDGTPKPFDHWPSHSLGRDLGTGWLATLDEVPGLLLRVSGLAPAEVSLTRVGDVEPHLVGTRAHLLAGYDAYGAD
ncbi:hypothetical protein KZZ52_50135 [Dactylosporangium sp. AC04546]|uniref:hypothetical protein n=1 Tax=Dactylosporangium sp. AC04546 TaxID=2862460 RepID=UPI001EDCBA1D|nr:hypothetical protein [Dactylosporangium sp. AC04546]WVK82040.1 hypothetical protein KZZ52_50135 [Dactylosporangium sp. AC04546]